jgi:hypothetical protein
MTGRGRGFLFKKPEEDEKSTDDRSEVASTISNFPILGRGGRGIKLQAQSQLSTVQQTTDSPSDADSSVSVFPLVGRGRGMLSSIGRGAGATSSEPKSSESDPIEQAKQYVTGQFDDLTSPKKVSSSSGRGRSSGKLNS